MGGKLYHLESDTELRLEVDPKSTKRVTLCIRSGLAEIFGTELVKGNVYVFTAGAKIAVWTYHGCTIEIRGQAEFIYTSAEETPMVVYSNCHAALETMRIESEQNNKRGPIAMVVGPRDVGKSTLCRILLNYAARMWRKPIFVELDVGQGHISIPGTVGAMVIERPADVNDGFFQEAPLVYNFGHKSSSVNSELYCMIINQLAVSVKNKLNKKRTRHSGAIINTCGWVRDEGYKQLLHAAKAFEVDVILVLDQERLHHKLNLDMPNAHVVFLEKSFGVVKIPKTVRNNNIELRLKEYFYGTTKTQLYPHTFDLNWSEIKLFKVDLSSMPEPDADGVSHGAISKNRVPKLLPLTPSVGILHNIVAISSAKENCDGAILSHVLGFICVTNVDTDRRSISVLSPEPKPLPKRIFVVSDVQFMGGY